ncbi:uncharacterized protein LOC111128657 [Crassostrea virginica]
MVCSKGESRCYQINVNNIIDSCVSHPCKNGGFCQTFSSGEIKCHCQNGFWGKFCENGFCDNGFCQNEAVCYSNNGTLKCLCPLGFKGPKCDLKFNENITDAIENGGHFTGMSLIEIVTCHIHAICHVPLSITRNVHSMPEIKVGYSDKMLEVHSMTMEASENAGGVVRAVLNLVGRELGLKTICLDSVATPITAKVEDEICFKIKVIEGHNFEPQQIDPHFINPTLPDSTVLQCNVNEQCHLSFWVAGAIGVEHCPPLVADKTIIDGVHINPLRAAAQNPCIYDSVILTDNPRDLHVCFYEPSQVATKDRRCYLVHVLPQQTVKGSCAGQFCYNAGFCDGSSSTSVCLCRLGFSGHDCSQEVGVPQGIKSYPALQPIFGDLALPKSVKCPLLKDCVIPFSVTNTNGSDLFNLTWNGTNIDAVNFQTTGIQGSRDVLGKAVIVHATTGTDKLCLSLTSPFSKEFNYDTICCLIETESTNANPPIDYGQGLFSSPSPSNNSELVCTPGQPCHIKYTLSKDQNQKCPTIVDRSEFPVHIFTRLSSEKCEHDAYIISNASYKGNRDYCLQLSSSGILGPIRCIKVHFENHVLPMLPSTTTTTTTTTTTQTTTMNITTDTTRLSSKTNVDSAKSTYDSIPFSKPNIDYSTMSSTGSDKIDSSIARTINYATTTVSFDKSESPSVTSRNVKSLTVTSDNAISNTITDRTTSLNTRYTQLMNDSSKQSDVPTFTNGVASTLATDHTTSSNVTAYTPQLTTTSKEKGTIKVSTDTAPLSTRSSVQSATSTDNAPISTHSSLQSATSTDDAPTSTHSSVQPTTSSDDAPTSTHSSVQPTTSSDDAPTSTRSSVQPTTSTDDAPTSTHSSVQPATSSDDAPTSTHSSVQPATSSDDAPTSTHSSVQSATSTDDAPTSTHSSVQPAISTDNAPASTHSSVQHAKSTYDAPASTLSSVQHAKLTYDAPTSTHSSVQAATSTDDAPTSTHSSVQPATSSDDAPSTHSSVQAATSASAKGISTGSQDILETTNARLGRLTTLPNSGKPVCDVAKVNDQVRSGRVECVCVHPITGESTRIISANPTVSRRSLGLAAGLGAGLVTAGLGLLSLLRILSKRYCKAIKSEPGQQHKTEEK